MSFARLRKRLRTLLRTARRRARQGQRAVWVHLTAGYVLLLVLSVGLLYGLAYWQMQGTLQARDREAIATELRELRREYAEDGRAALEEEIAEAPTGPGGRSLHIRLAAPGGRTLIGSVAAPPGAAPAEAVHAWPPKAMRALKARGDAEGWARVSGEEDDVLEVAACALPDGNLLQVGASVEPRAAVLEQFQNTFALAALPVLLLGLLGGGLLARRVLRPLRELARVARRIAATGEVAARVPLSGARDELDALARLFNEMLARIERLVEGMRETLDHVAHDLHTPLTRLRGRGELALQDEHATERTYREALSDLLEAAAQVRSVLDAIMEETEARAGTLPLHAERASLRTLADEVADLYCYVAEEKGVALRLRGDAAARVDRGRMRQAVANLVDNAVKYTPPGGTVRVEVSEEDAGAVVEVRDTGPGISEDDLPRIWDRLYRGDRSRTTRGLGLGLSLVRSIVEAHGGTVAARSAPGEGAVFTIRVPGAP